MSVYVKGMEMPKNCNECEFHFADDVSFEWVHQCVITRAYINEADVNSFPHGCPLVEVPTPHGRLIDADATMKQWGLDKATKYGNETAEQQRGVADGTGGRVMRVRVTVMTGNSVPVSELGENPERKIRDAWNAIISLINLMSEDSIYVENIELVEDEQEEQ